MDSNSEIIFTQVTDGLSKTYYNNRTEITLNEFLYLLHSVNQTYENFMKTATHDTYTDDNGFVIDYVTAKYPV